MFVELKTFNFNTFLTVLKLKRNYLPDRNSGELLESNCGFYLCCTQKQFAMPNKPIDAYQFDLDKDRDKVADLPGLIEFPHTVGSAVIKPEDMGKVKGKSIAAMQEQTEVQMKQLYEQMQVLAKQAAQIKERVNVSIRIYQSKMSFEPVIGKQYYLYQKHDGSDVLSMVSQQEWGRSMPYERQLASVKLLSDHTWEVIEGELSDLKSSS